GGASVAARSQAATPEVRLTSSEASLTSLAAVGISLVGVKSFPFWRRSRPADLSCLAFSWLRPKAPA
ncbi:hypothetical protein Tco_0329634, partial [Tanacetum coccineum]